MFDLFYTQFVWLCEMLQRQTKYVTLHTSIKSNDQIHLSIYSDKHAQINNNAKT